jgi:hypothetical protein
MRTGICRICGAEFTDCKNGGRTAKQCCSPKCASEWQHRQLRHEFVCKHCGKTYKTAYVNRNQYCSNECRFNAWHDKALQHKADREAGVGSFCKVYFINCIECGKLFSANHKAKVVCSDECTQARQRRGYESYAHRRKGTKPRLCRECGQEFVAPYGDKRRGFCSDECSKRFNGRIDKKIRRARKLRVPTERIDPRVVFERDSWRCGICRRKVNAKLKSPHPMSASLDHIIPLALGGSHTYDNVQCAHRICNSTKRDKPGGQLRLAISLT